MRRRARSGQKRSIGPRALVVAATVLAAYGDDSCRPDSSCKANRICEFSSEKAYDAIRNRLFQVAGCPLSCVDACNCTCGTSGPIYEALNSKPVQWCTDPICTDAMVMKAMNYDASFRCDSTFRIALTSVYELCGRTNGLCRNGNCTEDSCITVVDPPCRQLSGVSTFTSYAIGLYVMAIILLYLSGRSGLAVAELTFDPEEPQARPPPATAPKPKRAVASSLVGHM